MAVGRVVEIPYQFQFVHTPSPVFRKSVRRNLFATVVQIY